MKTLNKKAICDGGDKRADFRDKVCIFIFD